MPDGAGGRPTGAELGITARWCPDCGTERIVELVQLTSDPAPVAVCTECGAGVDQWFSPDLAELVAPPASVPAPRPGMRRPAAGRPDAGRIKGVA